jgi:hypothetical protein
MIDYRWTTTVIALVLGACLLWLVRRHHLHGPYAVWWVAVAIGVALLGLFPSVVDALARLLGVGYSPILVVVLGMGAILIKMLTMDMERTRQERQLRQLTQRLALLEAAVEAVARDDDEDESETMADGR